MRNRHFFYLDVFLLAGLPALAVSLRVESFSWPADLSHAVTVFALLALGIRLSVASTAGLYRCLWQHASISELQRILYVGALSGVLTFLLGTVGLTATGFAAVHLPYAALVLDALLATGVLPGPRLLGLDDVIIAMPKARGNVVRRVVQAASDAGIQARTIPGFDDLISGRVNVSSLRRVEIGDDHVAVRELA